MAASQPTKHVFVTGGVASSLGKGLTASSLGSLLKSRGLRVTMQKLDPYLNVDPGTMNPFQHGEVFVTNDGAETDLDIGHYERFLDEDLVGRANVTTGQVFSSAFRKDDVELRNTVERVLECMKTDGFMAELNVTWFGAPPREGATAVTVHPGFGQPGFEGYDPTPHELNCG